MIFFACISLQTKQMALSNSRDCRGWKVAKLSLELNGGTEAGFWARSAAWAGMDI
jgi:hypothetical protein